MTDPTAALRDRIAAALYPTYGQEDRNRSLAIADAVLAVLPEQADRAAVLREAAEAVQSSDVEYNTEAAEAAYRNGGPFALIAYVQLAIGKHLRRLAAEEQPATEAEAEPQRSRATRLLDAVLHRGPGYDLTPDAVPQPAAADVEETRS